MKKKYLVSIVILMFTLLVFMFAGCLEISDIPRYDYNVLTYDDIKDQEISLKFRVRSGVVSKALPDLIKEFEKQYPNIKIGEPDAMSGDYDLLRETTLGDINATNAPDIIIGYPDHFAEYFSSGSLVNLQQFINDKNVGYSSEEMADFVQAYMGENKGYHPSYPDDLYGLPLNKSTEVMVYNRTFFKALYGEDYKEKLPTTWAELDTLGKEITQKVKDGEADNVFVVSVDPKTGAKTYLKMSDYLLPTLPAPLFVPFSYDAADNAFITLVRQFGGAYTQKVHIEKGYVLFDNNETKDALTYFRNMTEDRVFAIAANFGKKYNSDLVETIQVVMTIGSSAGVSYNASGRYEYELGIAPIPYYSEDKKFVIQQGTNIAMLNQNTDAEKLAAWLFIKFLLEPENTARFAVNTGGYLPVRTSAFETEEYQEFLTDPALDQKVWSEAVGVALSYSDLGFTMFVDPHFNGSSLIRKEAEEIFTAVIVNNVDIKKRIEQAYKNKLRPYVREEDK